MNKKLIKEGAEKALAAKHGYDVYSEGKWYKTEEDAKKKRGGLTSDQLWNKFGKSEKTWVSGDPDSDPDFKGGNRYEEVEYIMNLLEKREKSLKEREISLLKRQGATDEDIRDYVSGNKRNRKVARMLTRAYKDATIKQDAGGSIDEESTAYVSDSFDLFPKSDERLLREYIREQYEARGIYPTAREVQETYNQVMSLLEKTAEEARIEEHKARRGKPTKISPSSPARQPSDEEIRTRKSGIKSTDIIDMMNKLRKTNR